MEILKINDEYVLKHLDYESLPQRIELLEAFVEEYKKNPHNLLFGFVLNLIKKHEYITDDL